MARRSSENPPPAKLVWRITDSAPLGEFVDPKVAAAKTRSSKSDLRENGWLASSLELLGGVRVSETPMDTLPGELVDQFFKKP